MGETPTPLLVSITSMQPLALIKLRCDPLVNKGLISYMKVCGHELLGLVSTLVFQDTTKTG